MASVRREGAPAADGGPLVGPAVRRTRELLDVPGSAVRTDGAREHGILTP